MTGGQVLDTNKEKDTASGLLDPDIQTESTSRGHWGSQLEYILCCVGYAVGFGNIMRFPYLCMRNGGGAFLIPYFTSLFLCGMPLFCMEVCVGQFSGLSPLQIWAVCPLFQGLGLGMLVVSGMACLYFNVMLTWTIYYLIQSFTTSLPWSDCGHSWNTPLCLKKGDITYQTNLTNISTVEVNKSLHVTGYEGYQGELVDYVNASFNKDIRWTSPEEEFWHNKVLGMTAGIEDLGGFKWDLLGTFCVTWTLVFLCLCKGIKSLGKVVYITATVPYLLITALLIRGVTLPGAIEGIKYYIIPEWSKLLDFQIWAEAMLQIFYTLGVGWGGVITMASYNKFHKNCLRNGVLVSVTTCLTSLYAGFGLFSVIGFMAHEANLPVKDVVTSGPGMAFVVYPEALSKMPISPAWAICFFFMLLTVGLDSQFGTFETVVSSIVDQYPDKLRRFKIPFTALVCVGQFLLGSVLVTRGGMYVFQIIDWFIATSMVFVGFCEIVALVWIYGSERLYQDIELMTGNRPSILWKVCWCVISPLILLVIMIYSLAGMKSPTYGEYEYPWWALGIGWLIAVAPVVPIPIGSVMCLLRQKGTLLQRLRSSVKPSATWGPADPTCRDSYTYTPSGGCNVFFWRKKQYKLDDTDTTVPLKTKTVK